MNVVHNFIGEGDKARTALRFRGRELTHGQLGLNLCKRVQEHKAEERKVQ